MTKPFANFLAENKNRTAVLSNSLRENKMRTAV
jgi:hypothetical protein